jgi:DNA-3-methyladenine glycosylase
MEKSAQVRRRKPRPAPQLPGRLLPRAFFQAPPEQVAPALLGKLLVCPAGESNGLMSGRIVETEAYLGPHSPTPDPAAHSHRGPTPRNRVLFGPAGHAYVYSIYGMYYCMNVTCEIEGQAGGVLLRAVEAVDGIAEMALNRGMTLEDPVRRIGSGPSRLCQAMGLTRPAHNGLDLLDPASPLQLRDDGFPVTEVLVTPRIGIRHAVDWPLRFALPGHDCVSGKKSLTGQRVLLR